MGRISFNTMIANQVKVSKLDAKTAAVVSKYEVSTGTTMIANQVKDL